MEGGEEDGGGGMRGGGGQHVEGVQKWEMSI